MNVGDKVSPKTPAGLWLADVPVDGEAKQIRKSVVVFRGVGTVIAVSDCVIDYDQWEAEDDDSDGLYTGIGKVDYRSCLVQFDDGEGWAGEGALVLEK